jgi:hypothetical protein
MLEQQAAALAADPAVRVDLLPVFMLPARFNNNWAEFELALIRACYDIGDEKSDSLA